MNRSLRRNRRYKGLNLSPKEGLAQGMKQGMKDTALRMLQAGKYALEEIAAISGLPVEEVQKLSEAQTA